MSVDRKCDSWVGGLALAKLGRLADGTDYTTVSNRVRPFQKQLQEDSLHREFADRVERLLENGIV